MLRTPELYIRRLEHDDLERTFQWLHRNDVFEGVGVHVPFSRSAQERWFTETDAAQDKIVLALCLASDDSHIGNLSLDQIDLFEINTAFSAVALMSINRLQLDRSKVNINGGAISIGHPIGASGGRLVATLLNGLEETGGRYGLATLCIGGGEAVAAIFERQ